jgi:hypothetical protein
VGQCFQSNQGQEGAAGSGSRGVAWLMRSQYAIATDCRGSSTLRSWRRISIGAGEGYRMHRLSVAVFMIAATAYLIAAPKFLAVWKSPEVSRLNFAMKKVAALVITDSQSLQMSGEEALARELTQRNVNGTPTYRFVPREELKSAEKAKPWFERAKVDGVVAIRPVKRESAQEYSPVIWSSGYYPDFWGYYGYGWTNVYVIPNSRETTIITVETLIYDLTRNQLIWAATSETRDPKNLQDFVKDLVGAAVKEMKKMKLVG